MNSHAQLQFGMGLERLGNFQRALYRCFRAVEEDQCHAITNREPNEFPAGFGGAKVLRTSNDLIQLPLNLALLVKQQL